MAVSFIKAMSEFFGKRAGTTLSDFQKELKDLKHEDRLYFARELRKVGIDCADPAPIA